jgi:hypothetical protein
MLIFNYFAYPRCMEIFPGVLNGCMNNSYGNISIIQHISALGAAGSNPKWNKIFEEGKKIKLTLLTFSCEKIHISQYPTGGAKAATDCSILYLRIPLIILMHSIVT